MCAAPAFGCQLRGSKVTYYPIHPDTKILKVSTMSISTAVYGGAKLMCSKVKRKKYLLFSPSTHVVYYV
jgi:hypothetical protein